MNDNTVKSAGAGIPIGTLVWIVLIVLRATGYIAMSWFWVITSIIWVPLGISLVVLLIVLILFGG